MLVNPFPTADTIPDGWHGSLDLVYAHRHGATQLIHNKSIAPLKVQRSFYPEGAEVCHNVVLHTAGGVVGGDRNSLNFQLEPNAQALITTSAAGKIYRSKERARQIIQVQVEAGGCLEWLPLETIVFNGAIYRQDLRVELAPGAVWLGWEITRFGRSARGERFLEGEWRSNTEIWQNKRPLWIDRQWLPGGEEILNSPHGLAGQPVVGSFAWVGQEVSAEIVEKARELFAPPLSSGSPLLKGGGGGIERERTPSPPPSAAGVTRLSQGLLCRYRGSSTAEVRNWFIEVWHLLRLSLLGRPSCLPRVWQL